MKYSTTYTTTEINRNFRIKVAGRDANGNRINTLVGVSGLIKLIGKELFEKFVKTRLRLYAGRLRMQASQGAKSKLLQQVINHLNNKQYGNN